MIDVNTSPGGDVSALLRAWSDGDQRALAKLAPIVYNELRVLARRYLNGERTDISLQTTALVNEAYLRLVDYKRMRFAEPRAFLRGLRATDAAHPGRPRARGGT